MNGHKPHSGWGFYLAVLCLCVAAMPATPAATSNVPSFPPKTVYNGLIYREEGAVPREAGYFRLDVSRNGSFTGKLLVGQHRAGFSGKFNAGGTAYVPVKVGTGRYEVVMFGGSHEIKKLEWTLVLQVTNELDEVVGQILSYQGMGWSGIVLGDRAGYRDPTNSAAQAGRYTVVLPGSPDGQSGPAGYGWGTLTVDKAGNVRLLGALPDNSKVTASSVLSAEGAWPLFVPSDGGRGMLAGWLQFTNSTQNELEGQLNWVRLSHPGARFFAEGFTNQTRVLASRYVPPARDQPMLNLNKAVLVLRAGELNSSYTNSLTLRTPNELRGPAGSRFLAKFSSFNGLFFGTAEVPGIMRTLGFRGAVLQNRNAGFGYFTSASRNGEVIIEEEPSGAP